MSIIRVDVFRAKAALVQGENPLPIFRHPDKDLAVRLKDEVPPPYRRLLGLDCGRRALPYRLEDRYDRNRQEVELDAIVMENSHLKATFLPTLGARLISLIDKEGDQELLYCNRGLQVGNLGILDAWFAGGIEWNVGQYGHTFTTNKALHTSIQSDREGHPFLRFYDFERAKGLWWHIDFHLDEDAAMLWSHTVVHNLSDEPTSMYYWTNTAVKTDDQLRVIASGRNAIYIDPYVPKGQRLFGWMEAPYMEIYDGVDVSYPNRFAASNEYFFVCDEDRLPWECALDRNGRGLFEVSTHPLSYRKMFCWGTHKGGRRWQRYLSPESEEEYVEIQSGLAPTQLHGYLMEGRSSISWTQGFGALVVEAKEAHDNDYAVAHRAADEAIRAIVDETEVAALHERFSLAAQVKGETILQRGSGWGYLEAQIQGLDLPNAFGFERSTVADDAEPYLRLLEEGVLPILDDTALPLAPPPLGRAWKQRFLDVLKESSLTADLRATLTHYLAIILLEEGEVSRAESCWTAVMEMLPNAWSARNLAALELRRGEISHALFWYRRAESLKGFSVDCAIAEEYCALLVQEGMAEEAKRVFDALPAAWLEKSEPLMIARAQVAAVEGDAKTIKEMVFSRELGHIREGETPLDELWFAYSLLTYTQEHQVKPTDEVIALVKERYPLPAEYDWNMVR